MAIRMMLIAAMVGTALTNGIVTNAEKKPAWQTQLDWAIENETGADRSGCPQYYEQIAPERLQGGGRACLMHLAIQAAKNYDDDAAFRLALVTQRDDPAAVQSLAEAGHELVAEYLRTREPADGDTRSDGSTVISP
jgi:hypothetical protein